jgi:hypothetical protein
VPSEETQEIGVQRTYSGMSGEGRRKRKSSEHRKDRSALEENQHCD